MSVREAQHTRTPRRSVRDSFRKQTTSKQQHRAGKPADDATLQKGRRTAAAAATRAVELCVIFVSFLPREREGKEEGEDAALGGPLSERVRSGGGAAEGRRGRACFPRPS